VVKIDILHLVDRLESLYNDSWQIPWTSNVMIDGDEYLELIDQMRISIPEEIKQANRIQQERERIIAQAHEEAERMVALARDQRDNLINEHEVLQAAQARNETIIERAKGEAEEIKADADEYVIEVLSELEEQLGTFLNTVRNGLLTLQERRQKAQETPEQEGEEAFEQQ
jgi:cell division septum initiation protein DivIVA